MSGPQPGAAQAGPSPDTAPDESTGDADWLSDAQVLAKFAGARHRPPCSDTLDMRVTGVDQAGGTVTLAMTGRPEWANPMGALQGGFVVAMLDEAMAVAGIVAGRMQFRVPTLELKTSYLRPCPVGPVTAQGRVVRFGRKAAFLEADLFDAEGRLVARASSTVVPTPIEGRAPRT
jgi:uncharacterized protein (TIGR00369 family)